jgi:hypothetical protein
MSIKLDVSDDFDSYKEELDRDLMTIQDEIASHKLTLEAMPKSTVNLINDLFSNSDNNVNTN